MRGKVPNPRVRAARREHGWTRQRLADQMNELLARDGRHRTATAKLVGKWEDGESRPSGYYAPYLAEALGRAQGQLGIGAGHNAEVAALAADPRPVVLVQLPEGAWPSSGVPDPADYGTLVASLEAARNAMKRRVLLRYSATLGAAVILDPVLPSPAERAAATQRPSRVDPGLLDELASLNDTYSRLDRRTGAPSVVDSVLAHLDRVAGLLHAEQPGAVRPRLATIAADTGQLAAWVALDLGEHGCADAYYRFAAGAAGQAGDAPLHAYVLGQMALARMGYTPKAPDDARGALELLGRANGLAERGPSVSTRAWLAAATAEAYAVLGDRRVTLATLEVAERALDGARPAEEPAWIAFFDHAALDRWRGVCLVRLGQSDAAEAALSSALGRYGASFVRARAGALTELATTHVQRQEIDQACVLAGQALDVAEATKSYRNVRRVVDLRRQLAPWRDSPAVRDLDERLLASVL